MKSNLNIQDSPMRKLVSQKFALLAKVGAAKRKASGFQAEAEFYCTSVTEALAVLEDALIFMNDVAEAVPKLRPLVNDYESRQRSLIRGMLNYWPKDTESQLRLSTLLESDGVASHLDTTPEGYISLSCDQILKSLGQIIEASSRE